MTEPRIISFWRAIESVRLLSPEQLVEAQTATAAMTNEPASVAAFLVRSNYLTTWQARELLGGRRSFHIGPYRLLEEIGSGTMGTVFKASRTAQSKPVAIKVLSPTFLENADVVTRFKREMELTSSLNHPNIVRVLGADTTLSAPIMVMEYLQGKTVRKMMDEQPTMDVSTACGLIIQALEGIGYAHTQGVIHRDIKPANLMVVSSTVIASQNVGTLKILDLGLATATAPVADRLTMTGEMLGTPDYMAPEQAQNAKSASERSDIYSLGTVLFEMLAGRLPFDGKNMVEKLMGRVTGTAPPLSLFRKDLPLTLTASISKMLARLPEHRFPSAAEAIRALTPHAKSA